MSVHEMKTNLAPSGVICKDISWRGKQGGGEI